MYNVADINILAALFAGMISFLSPCVLPLVPGYVSYIAGQGGEPLESPRDRFGAVVLSLWFALGFSTIFVILRAGAGVLSNLLQTYRYEANLVGGVIVIFFGMLTTGLVPLPWFSRDVRFHGSIDGGNPLGAYLLGLAFGFGWTPCIGPVLGAILTVSAASSTTSSGVVLLTIYSVGLGIPFLVVAYFAELVTSRLKGLRTAGRLLQFLAGIVMILMGLAMLTGKLSQFAYLLLEYFPILGRLG